MKFKCVSVSRCREALEAAAAAGGSTAADPWQIQRQQEMEALHNRFSRGNAAAGDGSVQSNLQQQCEARCSSSSSYSQGKAKVLFNIV